MNDDRRVIVVGSGPAGATAAKFLCEAGIAVTLLEAGARNAERGVTARIAGVTVARIKRRISRRDDINATGAPIELVEEIAPGGLSNHWSCAVPRFSVWDFRDAERAGPSSKWPLGYDDLAPWYDKVEPLLHIAGPAADVEQLPAGRVHRAWEAGSSWKVIAEEERRRGRNLTALPYAYGSDTTLTLSGTVFNSFVRILRPVLRSNLLTVKYDAQVERLELSPTTRRVDAVVYRNARTGVEERLRCRAVVLAAGAINTTCLLLASTSPEFPSGLGNTHGVLGRYLHEHPLAKVIIDLSERVSFRPPVYVTRPSLDRSPPLYAAAYVQWTGSSMLARSAVERHFGRLPWVGFNIFGTMAPAHENYVALAESPNGHGAVTTVHATHPPEAARTLVEARDEMLDVFSRVGLRPRLRWWRPEGVGSSVHFAGTCRMHASPEFGMLNAWSRLHAVDNVVVADSSAFTTGPEKNPALTAMALSARASARLAEDLRTGEL